MVYKDLCVLVLWMKVASALEGLRKGVSGYWYVIQCKGRWYLPKEVLLEDSQGVIDLKEA